MGKALLNLALGMLLILYFGFSWGFILYKYWYWFLLEVFPELPQITFLSAVGLKMFMSMFHNKTSKRSFKEGFYSQSKTDFVIEALVTPWVALFAGWIIYEFIIVL